VNWPLLSPDHFIILSKYKNRSELRFRALLSNYGLDPTSPLILVPALLNGFLVNLAFYLWLGLALLHGRST